MTLRISPFSVFSFLTFHDNMITAKSIEGPVMKLCHENNGAAIYVGRATTVHNPLFE